MTDPPRLATYVQPSLSEARIQRQWAKVNESPQHFWSHRSVVYSLSFAAFNLLLVFGYLWYRGSAQQNAAAEQIVVERDGHGQERVTLPEGVSIVVRAESRYRLAQRSKQRVHVVLDSGAAAFDVTPNKQRQVVVSAAGFDVEVVGTQFEVSLVGQTSKPDVAVRVDRGTVRVRSSGQDHAREPIRTLTAGESWSTRTSASPAEHKRDVDADAVTDTPSLAPSATDGSSSAATAATSQRLTTAKELFEIAQAARIKGNAREAASALDRLRHSYPSDPRAGLAAFELGRMRMDQLGDSGGAVDALNDAMRLDPSARFNEDARARLVQLYHGLGQFDRCRKAQSDYQSRYPSGPHAKGISGLCTR